MILPLILGAALSLVATALAAPARAGVTSTVSASILTVTADAADTVTIACGNDGDVEVNGQNPAGGPDTCSTITQIQVGAAGNFANTFDLTAVTSPPFSSVSRITADAGPGDDTILGGPLAEELSGGDGSDTLDGGAGADELDGNEDADILRGGGGDDTLTDNDPGGTDELSGGPGDDLIDGGIGLERVVQAVDADQVLSDDGLTGQGTDSLSGMDEARLTGGEGDNLLDASGFTEGPATLEGAGGSDTLRGGLDDDTLSGGRGSDVFEVPYEGFGTDTIVESSGCEDQDELTFALLTGGLTFDLGLAGRQEVAGGAILLQSDSALENARGSRAGDTLVGNTCDNDLFGDAGDDVLRALTGGDTLIGQDGSDTVDGGEGIDVVAQTADADQTLTDGLLTGEGPDTLISIEQASLAGGSGENGVDASAFTLGSVSLFGGGGNDTLVGTRFADLLDGEGGSDRLTGSDGADVLIGGEGDDHLDASRGRDLADGGSGNDLLIGRRGRDRLVGSAGRDRLKGGPGRDRLRARDGERDVVSGGPGRDRAAADRKDVLRKVEKGAGKRGKKRARLPAPLREIMAPR